MITQVFTRCIFKATFREIVKRVYNVEDKHSRPPVDNSGTKLSSRGLYQEKHVLNCIQLLWNPQWGDAKI